MSWRRGGTGKARSLLVLPWRVSKPLGVGDGRQPFDIGISSRADRTGRLPQQRDNFGLVPPQPVQQIVRAPGPRPERQPVAVQANPDAAPGGFSDQRYRAQSPPSQSSSPCFSGADWVGKFASLPSASSVSFNFKGLARTVEAPVPSASCALQPALPSAAKPLM